MWSKALKAREARCQGISSAWNSSQGRFGDRISVPHVLGLGPGRWLKLSLATRSALGRCTICGGTDRLQGHENWKYVEKPRSGITTLIGVDAICTICHSIQRRGRIQQLLAIGAMSPADERRLIRHLMRGNTCSRATFERHIVRSFRVWRLRSKKKWKIDWGRFEPMIVEAKAARDLYRRRRKAAAERRADQTIRTSERSARVLKEYNAKRGEEHANQAVEGLRKAIAEARMLLIISRKPMRKRTVRRSRQ